MPTGTLAARAALVLASAAAALLVAASVVFAVSFSEGDPLSGGGPGSGSEWDTDYDDYACDSSLSGSTIDDATLDPEGAGQGDAFDDALQVVINGEAFDDSDNTGELTTDSTGETLVLGPETMSGLQVTLERKALASSATLRTLVTLHNPTGSDITVPFRWDSNLGSDSDTGVRGSSSGDSSFGPQDRWVVTSDDPSSPSDPVNTFVLFGPDSPQVTPSSASIDEGGCLTVTYQITVPAGETRHMLFFNQLSRTNEEALDAVTVFDDPLSPDSEFLSGIPEEELGKVLNWEFIPPGECDGSVTSGNATVWSCQTVTPPTGGPQGFTPTAAVSFTLRRVSGSAHVCVQFAELPASPAVYKVVGDQWRQLYPNDELTGIDDVSLNQATRRLCFIVADNLDGDADPATGVISDPVVLGSLSGGSQPGGGQPGGSQPGGGQPGGSQPGGGQTGGQPTRLPRTGAAPADSSDFPWASVALMGAGLALGASALAVRRPTGPRGSGTHR